MDSSTTSETKDNLQRIAKEIAARGFCSRREAEQLIAQGAVTVEGELITTPAHKVTPGASICVYGKMLASTKPTSRVWLLHKPTGVITTHRDPQKRTTVFDILPPQMPRVISVGRLDYNTEGLLVLTNDGALARWMELPSSGFKRVYRCRAKGQITPDAINQLYNGCQIDGVRYASIIVCELRRQGANGWLEVTLHEGKNREIRKVLAHFGLLVSRLIRIQYGPFHLGDLPVGNIIEVAITQDLRHASPDTHIYEEK